ncbi:hypothetical protein MAPG_00191 [Magnaporthiopsis poae ATCC 64411]|uniref:Uncharacterized protein n=1 Tax=Magnaporthiopsis poae (strain ATCC 64411 / 73-15) TaxID=644358 RepID=A0A0C4DKC3_MAGP6|nr:hypothetical protein MAPG_00191 [Magnaporthiopsis poae ATCC 64411]
MLLSNKPALTGLMERRSAGLLIASAALLFMFLSYLTLYAPDLASAREGKTRMQPPSGQPIVAGEQIGSTKDKEQLIREAASNRTLGFGSIQFLNLPHRHDRFDAVFLQAYLTDIEVSRFPAVKVEDLKDQGLPPTENPKRLNIREKAGSRC